MMYRWMAWMDKPDPFDDVKLSHSIGSILNILNCLVMLFLPSTGRASAKSLIRSGVERPVKFPIMFAYTGRNVSP
jgi:hypothetical protein